MTDHFYQKKKKNISPLYWSLSVYSAKPWLALCMENGNLLTSGYSDHLMLLISLLSRQSPKAHAKKHKIINIQMIAFQLECIRLSHELIISC